MNKCYWVNNTEKLAQLRVATNLHFVKNLVSVKLSKAKHTKMKCAGLRCHLPTALCRLPVELLLMNSTLVTMGHGAIMRDVLRKKSCGTPGCSGHSFYRSLTPAFVLFSYIYLDFLT